MFTERGESMLKDTITYGGQQIITVFHENEELDVPGRQWKEREKVGRYWLDFEETSNHSAKEFPKEDSIAEQELLPFNHPLSPCKSEEFCAFMTRYRTTEKPSHIFLPNAQNFRLDQESWEKICTFTKRYTGIDLSKAPMACGDSFLFHYVQLCYHETKQGSIVVKPDGFDRIDIHFKRKNVICEFQSCPVERQTEIEFIPTQDWGTFDIFAYGEDKLWFYAKDVSFIHSISIRASFGEDRTIPLKKNGYSAKYTNSNSQELVSLGQAKVNLRLQQDQLEAHLLVESARKEAASCLIEKGSDCEVYNLANKMLDRLWDEVWLFDPYLLDRKGTATLIDWMRLLCGSPAKVICAVYYQKSTQDNAMTLEEARSLLTKDWALLQLLRTKPNSLHLLGLNEYVHDRFVLCRVGTTFGGISLGTSLNSLDTNYFCIHKLTQEFAKKCWETFGELIELHTVEREAL